VGILARELEEGIDLIWRRRLGDDHLASLAWGAYDDWAMRVGRCHEEEERATTGVPANSIHPDPAPLQHTKVPGTPQSPRHLTSDAR